MPGPLAHAPVLVAGDLNLDLVLLGDVVPKFGQAEQLLTHADLVLGGSASIMAHGLARLGVQTHLCARVGDDVFGRVALRILEESPVRTDAVEIDLDTPTGLSVIMSAPADRSILTLLGCIPTLTAASVEHAVRTLQTRHLHIASYFLQPGLARDLPDVLRRVRELGVTVSLDTNWDPSEKWDGLADMLPLVDWFFPNESELVAISHTLGASETDELPLARFLASFGPRIIVKAGAEGAWSVAADGPVTEVFVPEVDVVDTTGAGDSLDAGYIAALCHGVEDEDERMRWATAAGSLSTRGQGGTAEQPDLAELRATVGSPAFV